MHGPGWWRCISSDVEPEVAYPQGKIERPGRTVYLLENYDNVYVDLSAGSGYNALNRDMEFAKNFLEGLNHKLVYGTDLEGFFEPQRSHVNLLEKANLKPETYENIYRKNIERILGI